jgi:hypothetical protein
MIELYEQALFGQRFFRQLEWHSTTVLFGR